MPSTDMSLLTELVVPCRQPATDMSLLAELGGFVGTYRATDIPLLTELNMLQRSIMSVVENIPPSPEPQRGEMSVTEMDKIL